MFAQTQTPMIKLAKPYDQKNNKYLHMKKESKEMLRTIISNQELIMKALKIEVPAKAIKAETPKKSEPIKKQTVKKVDAKNTIAKTPAKKVVKK